MGAVENTKEWSKLIHQLSPSQNVAVDTCTCWQALPTSASMDTLPCTPCHPLHHQCALLHHLFQLSHCFLWSKLVARIPEVQPLCWGHLLLACQSAPEVRGSIKHMTRPPREYLIYYQLFGVFAMMSTLGRLMLSNYPAGCATTHGVSMASGGTE